MAELRIPHGWSAATFCFWGAATGHWFAAAIAAILVEISGLIGWRWELSARHFERLADLTSLGFAGLSVYQFSEHGLFGIYAILGAFPLCLIPLLIAQCFSTQGRIPLSAFIMAARRAGRSPRAPVDLRPTCGTTCLLAAATGTLPAPWYGLGVALTLAALLLANRVHRYAFPYFGLLLCLASMLALINYRGLISAQYQLSDLMQALITEIGWQPANPDSSFTAIGMLGRLKLSDRIVLRVETPRNLPLPLRLTEARYQRYQFGVWRNKSKSLTTLDPITSSTRWVLDSTTGLQRKLIITAERRQELGTLSLPTGATLLAGKELIEVQRHSLGAIVAEARPGFLRYTVDYLSSPKITGSPLPEDLDIPDEYRPTLQQMVAEFGANGQPAAIAVKRLEQFFTANFRYSLVQPGFYPSRMPLLTFLRETRHGHCEYFASATTLLLRTLGVPARYVVGFMVDEYSPLEDAFVARARHAHAWSEAYIDGEWRVVDTTPSLWLDEEAARASDWHQLADLWSWLRWQVEQLRRAEFETSPWLLASLPPLIVWLIWRLRGLSRRAPGSSALTSAALPLELKRLFEHLAKQGLRPARGDTTLKFLLNHWPVIETQRLRHVVALHYQSRFGSSELSASSSEELDAEVSALLSEQWDKHPKGARPNQGE
ncbi:MAG: hypothetical protein EXR86_10995 [Gammaproteobacteria bacterium]|nr:hypothetical protein [Gammaproteobacteria bacterium]